MNARALRDKIEEMQSKTNGSRDKIFNFMVVA